MKGGHPAHCHLFSSPDLDTEYFHANSLSRAGASQEICRASPQVDDGSRILQDGDPAPLPCSLESWEAATHFNPPVPQFPLV